MNKETGPLPFDKERVPRHIAFVMDGNGRWAKKRGLPRTAGHSAGSESFHKAAEILAAAERPVILVGGGVIRSGAGIVADSVPVGIIADASIANRVADLTIFVVRAGKLDRRQLPDIESLYQEKRLRNMALVLNGVDIAHRGYGYGYGYGYGRYGYGYGYGYGKGKKNKK